MPGPAKLLRRLDLFRGLTIGPGTYYGVYGAIDLSTTYRCFPSSRQEIFSFWAQFLFYGLKGKFLTADRGFIHEPTDGMNENSHSLEIPCNRPGT